MNGEGEPQGLIELSQEETKVGAVSLAIGQTGVEHFVADGVDEVFLVAGEKEVPAKGEHAARIIGAADETGAKFPKPPGKANPLHLPQGERPPRVVPQYRLHRGTIGSDDVRRQHAPGRVRFRSRKGGAKVRRRRKCIRQKRKICGALFSSLFPSKRPRLSPGRR